MRIFRFIIILISIGTLMFYCLRTKEKKEVFQIIPLSAVDSFYNPLDINHNHQYYGENSYMIFGFKDTHEDFIKIDSFVCANKIGIDSIQKKHLDFYVCFFKKPDIKDDDWFVFYDKDDLIAGPHNIICYYWWRQGTFMAKMKSGSYTIQWTNEQLKLPCW